MLLLYLIIAILFPSGGPKPKKKGNTAIRMVPWRGSQTNVLNRNV